MIKEKNNDFTRTRNKNSRIMYICKLSCKHCDWMYSENTDRKFRELNNWASLFGKYSTTNKVIQFSLQHGKTPFVTANPVWQTSFKIRCNIDALDTCIFTTLCTCIKWKHKAIVLHTASERGTRTLYGNKIRTLVK